MAKKRPMHAEEVLGYGEFGERQRERATRNTRRLLIVLILGVYGLALILSMLALYGRHRDLAELAQQGRAVIATVTDRSQSRKHPGDYYVDYTFTAAGREVTGYQKVSQSKYDQTRIGGPVTITYLPSNPKRQEWGTVTQANVAENLRSSMAALGFLVVLFALSIGIFWLCLPKLHRARQVFKG